MIKHSRCILLGCLLLIGTPTSFAETLDNLVNELIELRSQVEELNSELTTKKETHKAYMASLAAQKAELEAHIKRENLATKQLNQSIQKNRKLIKETSINGEQLKPVILTAIEDLRQVIQTSLPFKSQQRLDALAKLENQLITDNLDTQRTINRLWAFYEDEIRLSNENGIYRQTIELNGKQVLADIAKIGMISLYFKITDEQFGRVQKQHNNWQYQLIHDKDQKQQVAHLFDSLQKQIRQGYFQLPYALTRREQ